MKLRELSIDTKRLYLSVIIQILFVIMNEDGVVVAAANGEISPYFGDVAVTKQYESKAWNITPPSGGGRYIFALKFSKLNITNNDDIWMPDGQRLPSNSTATIKQPLCFVYEVGQSKEDFNCDLAGSQACPDEIPVQISTLQNFNLTFRNKTSRIRLSYIYRMCQDVSQWDDTSIALLCLTVFMLVLLIVVFVLFVRNKQTLIRLKMTQNQSQVDKSTTNNSGNSSSAQQMETPRSNQTSNPDAQYSRVEKAQMVDNVIYQPYK